MSDNYSGAGSSQNLVPIKEIRDGVVIMKDGSLRTVIMASSVNFALKSTDEQQSIIFQFQNFLNSLNFDVQIVIQSRKFDISPYINLLDNKEKEQTNDLLKIQTKEYIQFIKTFTEQYDIMTKNFFVVIPYSPLVIGKGFFNKKNNKSDVTSFETSRSQMEQRVGVVQQGLVRSGVRVVQLGTEELIEVYYQLFNPGSSGKRINNDE
jgi:type IV secretory pathway VirB4 component